MNTFIFVRLVEVFWLVLVVYLTVTAIGVKPDSKPNLPQSFGLLFGIIAAFLLPHLPIFRFIRFAHANALGSSIGILMVVAGMGFLVWARQHLGRNWGQTVSAKKEPELIASGPYRYVRHPMYAGGLLAAIGSAIVAGGGWIFLLIILGSLFLWRVGAERQAHGNAISERISRV